MPGMLVVFNSALRFCVFKGIDVLANDGIGIFLCSRSAEALELVLERGNFS